MTIRVSLHNSQTCLEKHMTASELLMAALEERRPVVLLVGQQLNDGTGEDDAILKAMLARLNREDEMLHGWRALLTGNGMTDSDYEWLSERFDRNVYSAARQAVLDVAWSAVFTSSIDPNFASRLESLARQPEQVLASDHVPKVPRSRSRPPVFYLYGKANEQAAYAQAPRTHADKLRRHATHTGSFLSRIAETVTSNGLLIIDSYDPSRDWLSVDELLAPLSGAIGLRSLWFGGPEKLSSVFADDLIDSGSLVVDPQPLTEVIAVLHTGGRLTRLASTGLDQPGVVTLAKDTVLDVPPALRLRVEASAAIVDDAWTDTVDGLEPAMQEQAFRQFHGDLGNPRTLVEGIQLGFAIEREFEPALFRCVAAQVRNISTSFGEVIVHGQSGTGKSVALARLVCKLRTEHKMPVLFASGRLPNRIDVDAFCTAVEGIGAPATIAVCDANVPGALYRDLASQLRSRGRRILVVGTSYRVDESTRENLIEAPNTLSSAEKKALSRLVTEYEGSAYEFDKDLGAARDQYALALLYRWLSASRGRIVSGISRETRATEDLIRHRSRTVPISREGTAIAEAFIRAGLGDLEAPLFEENEDLKALGEDAAGRLIDYVMVSGRLNCAIPLNLVIRLLNDATSKIAVDQIVHLFSDLDLFRWRGDAEGNDLSISPRLQFEADLICRRRLADLSREMDHLVELILGARPSSVDTDIEKRFLVDLTRKLDRRGPRGAAYSAGYLRFADALKKLREEFNLYDAGLMLREANFRRTAVWSLESSQQIDDQGDEKRYATLDEARATVEEALKLISNKELRASARISQGLKLERASIYGYLAVHRARSDDSPETVWSDYLAARSASQQSIAVSGEYPSLDVALWLPDDVLRCDKLPEQQRLELVADVYSTLDLVNVDDLPPEQQVDFEKRRYKLAATLEDQDVGAEALGRLLKIAPEVATYLQARELCSSLFDAETQVEQHVRLAAGRAAALLKTAIDGGIADVRCYRLFLQCKWAEATGVRLLRQERCPTPADKNIQAELLEVVGKLNLEAGTEARYTERLVEATLNWLLGYEDRAKEQWRSLDRDSDYEDSKRIVRQLAVAGPDGKHRLFRGRVEDLKSHRGKRWRVRIEGLGRTIALLDRDFLADDIKPGRQLRDFAIAFNYRGPIADPASRYERRS